MVIFDVPEIVDSPFCHNKTFPEGLEQRHVHGREKIDMGKRGQDRGEVPDNLFSNTKILIFDILIMKRSVLVVELPRLQSTVTNFFRVPWTFLLYPPFSTTTRHSSHDNRFSFVSERLEFNVFSFVLIWQIVTKMKKALCFTSSIIEIEIFLMDIFEVMSQGIVELFLKFKKLVEKIFNFSMIFFLK